MDRIASLSTTAVELVPVTRTFIGDTVTPIGAYLALAQPGRTCLLESVEGTDRISRYSFLGLDELERVVVPRGPRLLDGVRDVVARYRLPSDAKASGFCGGAVAVFAYDAIRAIAGLADGPPADVPFPDAVVTVPGTWLIFDHFTRRCTLLGLARGPHETGAVQTRLESYRDRLFASAPSVPRTIVAAGPARASLDETAYLERVARAQQFIRDGDAYQLQVGIRFDAPLAGGDGFDLYRALRARNPSPYMFYVDVGEGAILGASPEFLVRLDGRTARLRPLAGTRPRAEDPLEDARVAERLLADPKERAEHVMLVDLARNDLGSVCEIGSVHVDELMTIERYSHVMHIVSNVHGTLCEGIDAVDLLGAAFPAGTVTGTPKLRAVELIDTLEPVARGFYAGSVAHFDFNGDMDSCIVLRSAMVADGRAYWQASAGIVADSDPRSEYAEVYAKTGIVRETLGLER